MVTIIKISETSPVAEQELQTSCLISWIGGYPKDSDCPKDGDHPSMVKLL